MTLRALAPLIVVSILITTAMSSPLGHEGGDGQVNEGNQTVKFYSYLSDVELEEKYSAYNGTQEVRKFNDGGEEFNVTIYTLTR